MQGVRLITPEDIAKWPVSDVIAELKKRVPKPEKVKCKHQYKPYQQTVILAHGIADLEPFTVHLPDAPPIHEFVNYGLPAENQVFQRPKTPEAMVKIDRELKYGVIKRKEAIDLVVADELLTAFCEQMWLKRLAGDWQIIGGEPLHIPPTYWNYLSTWHLDIGLPHFRRDVFHNSGDYELHLCWDYAIVPHPYCYGLNMFTQRRVGKTMIGGNILYEPISRSYEWHGGLQSKTDTDGEKAFIKSVVKPWRRTLWFFQPIYSNSTFPKKEGLQFTPRAKKGKNEAIDAIDENELMSDITYESSGEMAYDGQKLHRYFNDEGGKLVAAHVYERWNIVKPCLWENDGTGNKIKGKAFFGTTVEEMEKKGGRFFKELWVDGDRQTVKPNPDDITVDDKGETRSGLWNWFTPSYCNEVFDKHGTAIVEVPTPEQSAWLKAHGDRDYTKGGKERVDTEIDRQKDEAKKRDIIRKKPRNIREAFESSITHCRFKISIINKRLEQLTYGYTPEIMKYMQFGSYEWVDGVFGGNVYFLETDKQLAKVHKIKLPGEENYSNKRIMGPGGKSKPGSAAMFFGAADQFKYATVDIKNPSKMSMGAAHTFAAFNPLIDKDVPENEKLTDDFIDEYLFRPDTVDEFCEDILKMAIYRGMKVYPENNLDDVAKFFKKHGFEQYLQFGRHLVINSESGAVYQDDLRSGSTTLTKSIETMFRVGAQYILNTGHRCKYYRTLRDFKEVDEDLNPYDLFVSSTLSLISAYDLNNPGKSKKEENPEQPAFGPKELRRLVYGY